MSKSKRRIPKPHEVPKAVIADLENVPAFGNSTAIEKRKLLAGVIRMVSSVVQLDRDFQQIDQRHENGQILAAEGREARKVRTAERAAGICRIYQRVRPSYPEGRAGNGAALAAVAEQYGSAGDRRTPITKQAIRKILKRSGIPCR